MEVVTVTLRRGPRRKEPGREGLISFEVVPRRARLFLRALSARLHWSTPLSPLAGYARVRVRSGHTARVLFSRLRISVIIHGFQFT